MPVPLQPGTATTVVSADTKAFRLGIESPSVRARWGVVKPRSCDEMENGLALARSAHYCPVLDAERARERNSVDFLVREARCVHTQLAGSPLPASPD
jgi:hypothetical protein